MKTKITITKIENFCASGTWEGDQTVAARLIAMLPITEGASTLCNLTGNPAGDNVSEGEWFVGSRHDCMNAVEASNLLDQLGAIRSIDLADDVAPLYMRYLGEFEAQPAYLEIGRDGSIDADYDSEIGNAVPTEVYHGVRQRISIPNTLTVNGVLDFIEEHHETIQALIAGMDERWDGSNWVGTLSESAELALSELIEDTESLDGTEYRHIEVMSAANCSTRDLLGDETISADTTDEEIEAIADRILVAMAVNSYADHVVCDDLVDVLRDERDELT